MARLESGVLGNALDGVPEGEDADNSQVEDPEKMTDEEKVDVEKKVDEALEDNFEKHDKIAKIHNGEEGEDESCEEEAEDQQKDDAEKPAEGCDDESKDAEKPKDAELSGEKEEAMETDKPEADEADLEGGEKEGTEAEDEDPTNLQLAWEMLELAKVVYTKTAETSKDAELERRLCETYMVLGEISLENENYQQAVEDLTICLNKRIESLAADSRCIAESHYELGIAQGFDMKWDESVASLEAAIKVLETRIGNLKADTESPEESKKEVIELEALIPDIKEKITDTIEMKAESIRKIKEAVGFTSGSNSSAASTSSDSKPVSSIAIKRKD